MSLSPRPTSLSPVFLSVSSSMSLSLNLCPILQPHVTVPRPHIWVPSLYPCLQHYVPVPSPVTPLPARISVPAPCSCPQRLVPGLSPCLCPSRCLCALCPRSRHVFPFQPRVPDPTPCPCPQPCAPFPAHISASSPESIPAASHLHSRPCRRTPCPGQSRVHPAGGMPGGELSRGAGVAWRVRR